MIRHALLLYLALFPLTVSARDTPPTLKARVVVSAGVVTLGDLVEGTVPARGTPLFQAPEFGGNGTIQAWRVVEAAKALGVEAIETGGISEVRVERRARRAGEREIADLVADEGARRLGIERNRLEARLDDGFTALAFDVEETATLAFERLNHDSVSGRFEAVLVATDPSGTRSRPARVTGALNERVEVVRLRRALARGDIISAADIAVEQAWRGRVPADVVSDPRDILGQAARRALAEGTLPRPADLEKPRLVARGAPVTITLEAGRLSLSARGQALQDGTAGEIIDVRNVASRRVIRAAVTGPGRVTVSPTAPRRTASSQSDSRSSQP